jgi:hypothetical protein
LLTRHATTGGGQQRTFVILTIASTKWDLGLNTIVHTVRRSSVTRLAAQSYYCTLGFGIVLVITTVLSLRLSSKIPTGSWALLE